MRIWVTGGSGALGQELVPQIKNSFFEADIRYPTSKELNLEDFEAVANFVSEFKPTHVYHLAARVFGVGGHTKTPEASLLANTKMDNSVFRALFENPPKWIYYASTVAAYGYPFVSTPIRELDLLAGEPHESEYGYAMSKRLAIAYLELLKRHHGSDFVYGLSTNLFGSGDRFLNGGGHVMVSLLQKAKLSRDNQTPLSVWGEPTTTRDFLSTKSAAAIIAELTNKHIGIVNIASGQEVSIKAIAEIICESFNIEAGFEFTHERQGIPNRVCSIEKLSKHSSSTNSINSIEEIKIEVNRAALQI